MSAILRAGVAGAGVFGGFHAAKYHRAENAALAAVYDPTAEKALDLAGKFDAAGYDDYGRFLDDVDIVTVASPAATHFELAAAALKAGKHVYVEKPITLTLDDADALIALAADAGLALQVGHQERFVVDAFGLLGGEAPLRASFTRCGPPSGRCEDVSAVFDLMIHDLDLARMLIGEEPARIKAEGDAHEASAVLYFNDGREARFETSRRRAARDRKLVVAYPGRSVEIDFVTRTLRDTASSLEHPAESGAFASAALSDPLGLSVAQFIGAAQGDNAPAVTGEEGRDALRWALLIDEAVRSARGS